jgi:hypothetical protein
VQTYDHARQRPYPTAIPSARHAPDRTPGPSATPIYDALYTEYLRSYRTLPGDRSGEEGLVFRTFAAMADHAERTGHGHARPVPSGLGHPGLGHPGFGPPGPGPYAPGPWAPGNGPGPAALLPALLPGRRHRAP